MLVGNAVRSGAGVVQERHEVQRRSRADQRSREGRCSGSCAASNRLYVTVRKRNGRVDAQAGRWMLKCQTTRSVIGCCGAERRTRSEAMGAEVRLACLLGFSKRGRWQAPGTRIGSRPFERVQKARAENRLLDVNQIETGPGPASLAQFPYKRNLLSFARLDSAIRRRCLLQHATVRAGVERNHSWLLLQMVGCRMLYVCVYASDI